MATNVSLEEHKERAVAAWQNKNESTKKGEIMREIQKLKVQIQAMEREKCTHLYSKRSDYREDFCHLEELDNNSTSQRKSEQIKLKQQLEKISHMVKRFHKELRDVQPTPEFVERLKIIMEDIEGTINAFKEQQRKQYEEMLLEERTTWLEIQALEKKFESWSQLGSDTSFTRRPVGTVKPLASARDITKDLPPEVAAFEKFVEQSGGIRGGWDEYDHQTFLKYRQRYQGKPLFLQHLLPALPTKTEEEIHTHEEWYQEYLFLNETKKEAIKKWRDKREEEKEELLAKAEENMEEKPDEKQERLKAQMDQERIERKLKLNAYKVQKELERAQREEKKLREQLDRHKKQQEWKQRQEEMKMKVLVQKKQREEEEVYLKQEALRLEEEEKECKRQIAAREIMKFRERDEKQLQEKMEKEKKKELEILEKEKRLENLRSQVEVQVDRDPERLLQPTAGWRNRANDKSASSGQVLLNMMPHRAIPSWRLGP